MPSAYRCQAYEICCQENCEDPDDPNLPLASIIVDEGSCLQVEAEPALTDHCPPAAMTLEFLCRWSDHSCRSIVFTEAPLGITFKAFRTPVEVKVVQQGSPADVFGVGPDWVVLTVDGEDVSQSDWKYVVRKVDALSRSLPRALSIPQESQQALRLDFEVEGLSKTVWCSKLPLGLWLAAGTSSPPVGLLVGSVSPNGHAEQLGIQKGWSLQKVGGRSVLGEDPQDVFDSITTSLSCGVVQAQVGEFRFAPDVLQQSIASVVDHGNRGRRSPQTDTVPISARQQVNDPAVEEAINNVRQRMLGNMDPHTPPALAAYTPLPVAPQTPLPTSPALMDWSRQTPQSIASEGLDRLVSHERI